MDNDEWRAEEGFFNAWPSERTLLFGGYGLRTSGGSSRRVNSLNPLRCADRDLGRLLPEIEETLEGLGRPLIVRVPSMSDFLQPTLTELGFRSEEGSTLTLRADLQNRPMPNSGVELTSTPTAAWLAARAKIAGAGDGAREAAERTIALITVPARFAALRQNGEITAVALGVVSRGILLIEAVATHKDARRQGGGTAVTGALMAWAARGGAAHAALQVLAENDAAIRLYHRLGFTRELYRYCYRAR